MRYALYDRLADAWVRLWGGPEHVFAPKSDLSIYRYEAEAIYKALVKLAGGDDEAWSVLVEEGLEPIEATLTMETLKGRTS